MRRLRLVLEYDGTSFCGFQRQPDQPSVQETLEVALSTVCGHPIATTGAGRTDAGVHALGQVVHFETTGRIRTGQLAMAVGAFAGPGLVVREVEEAAPDFHARYSAVARTYHYYVCRERPSPFLARYVAHAPFPAPEGLARMREALPALLGRHDFAAFRSTGSRAHTTVRTMLRADLEEHGPLVCFAFTADAFLRAMVRNMVGLLLEIARGRQAPGTLARALETGARTPAVPPAPPQGLCLVRVEYPDGFPHRDEPDGVETRWSGPKELVSIGGNAGRETR